MSFRLSIFLYSLLFLVFAAVCTAHIGEYDEYWHKKSAESNARAQAAYHPEPEDVVHSFNDDVVDVITRNSSRRGLKGNKPAGPCLATNPIDRCWRCRADWATPIENRKRLVNCVKGFGRQTTGGRDGPFYVVTDPSDDELVNPKFGTLRYGVIQDGPLWIIFAHSMVIELSQELIIASNKTIDGRGAQIHFAFGAGFTIQDVHNIIIHNINIHNISSKPGGDIASNVHHHGTRTRSDGDGISICASSNIWMDHISMHNCSDGLIDIIENSTAITLSNGHFTQHDDCMLFGARDSNWGDAVMQVTVAFNHYGKGLVQRMPRCRWGFVHVVNNDYTHWTMYAIGGSAHPTIVCQGNRFTAPPEPNAKEVTKRDYVTEDTWKHWTWISQGDIMRNGAYFRASGSPTVSKKFDKKDFVKFKPGLYAGRLTRFSGVLNCRVGKMC